MILRTFAALDSVADGTVVLDVDGDAWQKRAGDWWLAGSAIDTLNVDHHGPFRTMRAVDE